MAKFPTWASRGGAEEENEGCGVEKEEEAVELGDLFADRIDLSLFEGYSVED